MMPVINLNIVDSKTNLYQRIINVPVKRAEGHLRTFYGQNCCKVILTNSGLEATATILDLIKPKTVIIDSESYIETRELLDIKSDYIKKITMNNINDLEELEKNIQSAKKPCIVYGDSPSVLGKWLNVKDISRIAHKYDDTLVVMDNSMVSMYYSNPIQDGADIISESYSKYVCGYGDCIVGGIVLSNRFDTKDNEYKWGKGEFIFTASTRGNCVDAFKAYSIYKGLETLHLRCKKHTENATYIYNKLLENNVPALYSGKGGVVVIPNLEVEKVQHKFRRFVKSSTFGCTYSSFADFSMNSGYHYNLRLSVGIEENKELLWDDVYNAVVLEEFKK